MEQIKQGRNIPKNKKKPLISPTVQPKIPVEIEAKKSKNSNRRLSNDKIPIVKSKKKLIENIEKTINDKEGSIMSDEEAEPEIEVSDKPEIITLRRSNENVSDIQTYLNNKKGRRLSSSKNYKFISNKANKIEEDEYEDNDEDNDEEMDEEMDEDSDGNEIDDEEFENFKNKKIVIKGSVKNNNTSKTVSPIKYEKKNFALEFAKKADKVQVLKMQWPGIAI